MRRRRPRALVASMLLLSLLSLLSRRDPAAAADDAAPVDAGYFAVLDLRVGDGVGAVGPDGAPVTSFALANPAGGFDARVGAAALVLAPSGPGAVPGWTAVLGAPNVVASGEAGPPPATAGAPGPPWAVRNQVHVPSEPVVRRYVNTPGALLVEMTLHGPASGGAVVLDLPVGGTLVPLASPEPLTIDLVEPREAGRAVPVPALRIALLPARDDDGRSIPARLEMLVGPQGVVSTLRVRIEAAEVTAWPVSAAVLVSAPGAVGDAARERARRARAGAPGAKVDAVPSVGGAPPPPIGAAAGATLEAILPDVGDGLRLTREGTRVALAWDDASGPFNVYRGDTGGSFHYNHTCFLPGTTAGSTTDVAATPAGRLWYYLVSRTNAAGDESVLGRDSAGGPIPNAAACASPPPWWTSPPSKPYVLVLFPTGETMSTAVADPVSCTRYPATRSGLARCALQRVLLAAGGEVEFGLVTNAVRQGKCTDRCYRDCLYEDFPGATAPGCGAEPDPVAWSPTRRGANVVVPVRRDDYWSVPPSASNATQLLSWVDNDCTGSEEFFAYGGQPTNGLLRDALRYFAGTYANHAGTILPSPLSADPAERACRPVAVILLTDRDDACDSAIAGKNDAANAAAQLLAGVTVGGKSFPVRTHVVGLLGGTAARLDEIAAAGGTGSASLVTTESQLTETLLRIVTGMLKAEVCDNADNNCNGQVDEADPGTARQGFCNVGQTCCAWSSPGQRAACLSSYQATITTAAPRGDRTKLPCTSVAQSQDPASWLCYDPGESCDFVDNNCAGGVDEGTRKCGSPAHCPQVEVCDGKDNDCDGLLDEGVCDACVPSPEVCDGCDNDCDGLGDEGLPPTPCGSLGGAPNCNGYRACPQVWVPSIGGCSPQGGGYGACQAAPQPEVCDGMDNDCNGVPDDGDVCPCAKRTEVCNGLDDDCDGSVDEAVLLPSPVLACGVSPLAWSPECTDFVQVACVDGRVACAFPAGVCSAGSCASTAEICDAYDNDCDGVINENLPAFGSPCASDDGQAPDTSPCRTVGVAVCDGPHATRCSATRADCASLPGGCEEHCDGIDNDCDGAVDEAFAAKGSDPRHFVRPEVTQAGTGLFVASFEASRPNAGAADPGTGNGYRTSAPAGVTLDGLVACSVAGRVPWTGVTGAEAEQACAAAGGHVCTLAELQAACRPGGVACTWAYAPRGSACQSTAVGGVKFCNLGPTFDHSLRLAGDQDGVLATPGAALAGCYADWSGLAGNAPGSDRIYDLTGNLRELAGAGAGAYALFGGATVTSAEAGAACSFASWVVDGTFQSPTTGFRCCFGSDPRE